MFDYGLVSIVMPTWNCARFIGKSIESVQRQTYSDWELIIVDDRSTDDTALLVSSYLSSDNRITYKCLERNSGAAVARNTALQMARGRWIAFLDSDDLWTADKLERQLSYMAENDYAFTYHRYREIDECGRELGILVSGRSHVGKFGMWSCCWPGCLSVVYDSLRVGLIQIPDVRKNNDIAMWLKVISRTGCHLFPETLGYYRRRRGSITPPGVRVRIEWYYILFRRAMGCNAVGSALFTFINIMVSIFKKLFFVSILDDVSGEYFPRAVSYAAVGGVKSEVVFVQPTFS